MAGDVKRVALVIGNGAYTAAPPLMNPRNDAQGMGSILAQLGFAVISGLDLGRDAMEDKLIEFETAIGGASAAMLFYAGHGLQVKGHNYLVPVDVEIHQEIQLKRRAFSLDEILDIMVRRARASLVFLDACRDNPFSRSLLSGMSVEERGRYLIRSGLAEVKASQGSFVAFATAPDNVASDGKGSNSPFTEALLAHIEMPDVSVSDMMIAVRNDVLRSTDGRQEPWDQSSLRERFCFKVTAAAKPPEPEQVSPAPIDDRTVEHTWWVNIQNSQVESDFEGFLAKFPHGEYVQLAKTRLAEMEWNRIKGSKNIADFEAFIARWPDNRLKAAAQARLAALRRKADRSGKGIPWKIAAGVGTAAVVLIAGYTLWSGQNGTVNPPPGELTKADAEKKAAERKKAEDDKAFATAERANTVAAFEAYVDEWPDGQHIDQAGRQIAALKKAAEEAEARRKREEEEAKRKAAEWRDKVAVMVRTSRGRDKEQWLKPGEGKHESFQDCVNRSCSVKGPEMVVVPKGRFLMGTTSDETEALIKEYGKAYEQYFRRENPQHKVEIAKPFAVGKTHVTRGEFAAFVKDTDYNTEDGCYTWKGSEWKKDANASWRSPGFEQSDTHPVVCVNWNDAKAYVKWLSKTTGKSYRLMTEAEAEYVARGVTKPDRDQPRYFFGNDEADLCTYANGADKSAKAEFSGWTVAPCKDGYVFTAPVAQFKSNTFGLYDVHGNAWTWTEDRWHANYDGAPTDGSAWLKGGNESRRVLRGGSWYYFPQFLRAASRLWRTPVNRNDDAGFRVCRTLPH